MEKCVLSRLSERWPVLITLDDGNTDHRGLRVCLLCLCTVCAGRSRKSRWSRLFPTSLSSRLLFLHYSPLVLSSPPSSLCLVSSSSLSLSVSLLISVHLSPVWILAFRPLIELASLEYLIKQEQQRIPSLFSVSCTQGRVGRAALWLCVCVCMCLCQSRERERELEGGGEERNK